MKTQYKTTDETENGKKIKVNWEDNTEIINEKFKPVLSKVIKQIERKTKH